MYSDTSAWTNKDGTRRYKWKYQCGHYAKSKFGQCKKNAISAEWIEAEVIEYTKLLVRNQQFAEDIQSQIGQRWMYQKLYRDSKLPKETDKAGNCSKSNLEQDIDSIYDDDKNAERKRRDMNNRLNKIYEEIYSIRRPDYRL